MFSTFIGSRPGPAAAVFFALYSATPVWADSTPPSAAGPTTVACQSTSGNTCIVADANFSISVSPASDSGGSGIDPNGYQICRSDDTDGWGGCEVNLSLAGPTSFVVSGGHRPAPGKRRAYYFRSRDNAGNWGPWNTPRYVKTAGADNTPPTAPGPTTTSCQSTSGNTCLVADGNFTLSVSPASDSGGSGLNHSGYQYCRSNNTSGWGGCEVSMTTSGGTSYLVTGGHRPPPGQRRAYYVRARDNAGNWGPWNTPRYIQTDVDTTPPTMPGPTTVSCQSTSGNTCLVPVGNFTVSAAAASDAGSGVAGYQICRSNDVTGWGGCAVNLTLNGGTSMVVSGDHRPAPGARRAYYFRAKDHAGNWGPWNDERYVQTLPDDVPPSVVSQLRARIGGQLISGLEVSVANPTIAVSWQAATDNDQVSRYQVVLQRVSNGSWLYSPWVNHPTTQFNLATSGLIDGQQYQLWVRAEDRSGNHSGFVSGGVFSVDLVDPDTTPPSTVGNLSAQIDGDELAGQDIDHRDPTIAVSWSAASDASGISRYQVILRQIGGSTVQSLSINHPQTSATVQGSGLTVGQRYQIRVRAQDNADNWGSYANSGTFRVIDLPVTVFPGHELVVNSLAVVEDPTRTTGCGAWTFCAMMTSLAGGQDPADYTRNWLRQWESDHNVNGDLVEARSHMLTEIVNPWPKQANGKLDLTRSPFRLLAIVNRADLTGPGDAGEARMVYGTERGSGFTVIFEYKMSTALMSRGEWWSEWHRLNLHPNQASAGYLEQLQFLTDTFARTPINGRISLGQVRTNDGLVFATTFLWEWREFNQNGPGAPLLHTTVKQTPQRAPLFGFPEWTEMVTQWIDDNETALLNQTHVISAPLQLAGNDTGFGFYGDHTNNPWARLNFSQATCSGCHVSETTPVGGAAPFFHIKPRPAGQVATLSQFFFNTPLCVDLVHSSGELIQCWNTYTQNEMGRRKSLFEARLRSVGYKSDSQLKTFQPTREPDDAEAVKMSTKRVH